MIPVFTVQLNDLSRRFTTCSGVLRTQKLRLSKESSSCLFCTIDIVCGFKEEDSLEKLGILSCFVWLKNVRLDLLCVFFFLELSKVLPFKSGARLKSSVACFTHCQESAVQVSLFPGSSPVHIASWTILVRLSQGHNFSRNSMLK